MQTKEQLDKICILMDSLKKTTDIYFYLNDNEWEENKIFLTNLCYPVNWEWHRDVDETNMPDFIKEQYEREKKREKVIKLDYKGFNVYYFNIL